MTILQPLLWLCVSAYGIHVLEEFTFDWQSWAWGVLKLPARWSDFYLTNVLVIFLGIVAVEISAGVAYTCSRLSGIDGD